MQPAVPRMVGARVSLEMEPGGLPVGKQRGVGRWGNIIRTSTGGGAMSTEN